MSDPQPQNSQSKPEDQRPWANPMDAPPPFPNTGTPYSSYARGDYSTPDYTHQIPSRVYGDGRQAKGDERMWAMLAHLSAPIAAIASMGWLTIVGPLVVWFLQKDRSRFVRNASAGAFNFTITMWLLSILGWILTITVIGAVVGIPLLIISGLGSIVLGVVGAIKSWGGEAFTYPWQVRLLS